MSSSHDSRSSDSSGSNGRSSSHDSNGRVPRCAPAVASVKGDRDGEDPPGAVPGDDYPERGVPFWLPPTGTGNGLVATAWAQILELPGHSVAGVLALLAQEGIAGFVDLGGGGTGGRVTGRAGYRLWVDSHQYSRAEDLLMRVTRTARRNGAA